MSKLDIFIDVLNKKSDKPVKGAFNMTLDSHVSKEKHDDVKDIIMDELNYYLLTDFMDGCGITLKMNEFNDEMEMMQDIISFCKTKTLLMNFAQSLQSLQIKLKTSLKHLNEAEKHHIERFIYMGLSYHDERYIAYYVEHLIEKESFDVEVLLQFINKRVIENQQKILKL